ncbi:MAG: hypothetical protein JWO89_3115, partial [Verrucomicrobiaceae bacterium]|nr:hypothetical protein [Verrucomicrobiaceae bacterium]
PVWLDADGDGKFESAYAYAERLIMRTGTDGAKLEGALKAYDEAVAIQARALVGAFKD